MQLKVFCVDPIFSHWPNLLNTSLTNIFWIIGDNINVWRSKVKIYLNPIPPLSIIAHTSNRLA